MSTVADIINSMQSKFNPSAAAGLDLIFQFNIEDGEMVRVSSRRGDLETAVKVTDIIDDDIVFMPFHFAEGAANVLTNNALDPVAKIPELKVATVNISKIS